MQKSVRLLKIWKLCRDNRYMTVPKLARECDVAERTIYRDILDLGELGVTIYSEGSGYRVRSEDLLPQLNFTPTERMILTMALRALPLRQDKELEDIANSLFNKLLDRPEGEHLTIFESNLGSKVKGRSFARLQKAIDARRYVTLLDYVKFDDQILPERRVAPYHLVHRDRHWYLIAWTEARQDFQTYRLDRINKLRIEDATFAPRPFDLQEYFRGTIGVFIDAPQRLRARFTGRAKEVVRKDGRFVPEDMRDDGDGLLLDTTIRGEILWLRWIIGFGGEAEILAPAELRAKAKAMLQEGLGRYGR